MKDKIIEIALQQFLKHGIRKMTVQRLIEPMGISTKTFYRHFSDKEDLLKYCLLKHYGALVGEIDRIRNESKCPVFITFKIWYRAMQADFGINRKFYYDLNHYYPLLQDLVLHKFFKKDAVALEKLIDTGIEQGYFRSDIIPEVVPEVISALYASITRTNQFKKYRLTTNSLMQNTIEAYLRGICTEKGLEELEKNYLLITK